MSWVNTALAIVAILLQAGYVIDLFLIPIVFLDQANIAYEAGAGDPKLMAGAISTQIVTMLVSAIIGLFGIMLSWFLLKKRNYLPGWFVLISRMFAIAWMIFIPIGTILGFMIFRWSRLNMEPHAAT